MTILFNQTKVAGAELPAHPTGTVPAKDTIIVHTPGEDVRLERSIITGFQPKFSGPFTTTWVTPVDSPGLRATVGAGGAPLRGPFSYPFTYYRNKQVMDEGFVAEVDVDHGTGWATFTGASTPAHLQHMVVGLPLDNMLPDLPDWTRINVNVGASDSIAPGPGVTLTPGPDHGAKYRCIDTNVDIGLSGLNQTFYGGVWMRLNVRGKYPPRVWVARYDPNKHATDPTRVSSVVEAQMPDPMPIHKWFYVEFPATTILNGATDDQVRITLWSPQGASGCSVSYCGARLVGDPGITVPPGASSADMAGALINHGCALQGLAMSAVVVSASDHIFPDDGSGGSSGPGIGFKYPFIDHAGIWSSAQSYSAEVDMPWDPRRRTMWVGGTGTFGTVHDEIVFNTSTRGTGGKVSKSAAPSDQMLTSEIMQDPQGSNAREEAQVDVGAVTPWRDVRQAYDGTLPNDLIGQATPHVTALSDVTRLEHTLIFPIPPGGTSPMDWLLDGPGRPAMRVGDSVAVRTSSGAYATSRYMTIDSFDAKPDSLQATAVPAS